MRGALWAFAILFCCSPTILHGQEPWPYSFELGVGVTRGTSTNDGYYRGDQVGLMGSILIGRRLHAPERGGAFVAIAASGHAPTLATTDDCLIDPEGGCVPWYPDHGGYFLLGGWESKSTRFRILGGAGLVRSGELDSGRTLGIATRIDVATPPLMRLSLTGIADALLVPSSDGETFAYLGLGFGLRVR